MCVCALILLILRPAPAAALVTPIGSPQFGVEPHSITPFAEPTLPLTYHGGPVMHSNKTYAIYWDPTPSGLYDGDWKSLINQYFQDVGTASGTRGNVYAVTPLYTDSTGGRAAYRSSFMGAYTDRTAYPGGGYTGPNLTGESVACVTDAQLRSELTSFVSAHGLPTGLGTIFFIFTPPGVTICTDGGTATGHCSDSETGSTESYKHSFCSYHSFTGSGASTILYAAQPWTAGTLGSGDMTRHNEVDCQNGSAPQQEPNQLLGLDSDGDFDSGLPDVIINEISVEQIATETDPLLNGWYAPSGQPNAGNEMVDQCRNWFQPKLGGSLTAQVSESNDSEAGTLFDQSIGGHPYYLNTEYDQVALSEDYPGVPCIPGVSLAPLFAVPNPVNNGEVVGFDGSESNVSLGATSYTWNFGDGSAPGSGASVFHSFTYGGPYQVSLTITDGGGNTATVANTVTVVGPPPPPAKETLGPTQTTSTSSTSSASSSSSGGGGGTTKAIVNPAATASVLSKSLRNVLRSGLVVRYSVNERVTGRFEVLLATSLARRIGLHGSPATGLAKGTAAQTIIGKAILVTTAAGRNTVKIQFSKANAARLRHLHNPSLMLRLIVRNASAGTATVLSTITLSA